MNIDRLNRLVIALRSRDFPENTFFNYCYFKSDFVANDDRFSVDLDGDLYDKLMEVKLHVNGEKASIEWCGTVSCIAGIAIMLFMPEYWSERIQTPISIQAQLLLGLTDDQASELFAPGPFTGPNDWERVTPEQAAEVVYNLMLTGNVDWALPKYE